MITQQELLHLPNQGLENLVSTLKNNITRSKAEKKSLAAHAQIIRRGLWLIREEIFNKEKYPKTRQYKEAFIALADAYSVAKELSSRGYNYEPKEKEKMGQRLNWRTDEALQKLEEL